MHIHFIRVAWIASAVLVVGGALLVALFPRPFISYYCASTACPTDVSGGFSGGYVVIGIGLVVAVVAAIISVVTVADPRRHHQR